MIILDVYRYAVVKPGPSQVGGSLTRRTKLRKKMKKNRGKMRENIGEWGENEEML